MHKKGSCDSEEIFAIEIKSSDMANELSSNKTTKSLENFKKEFPNAKLYIVCQCKNAFRHNNVIILPYTEIVNEFFSTSKSEKVF